MTSATTPKGPKVRDLGYGRIFSAPPGGAVTRGLGSARYDKVTAQASVPGTDGQQLGAGAEEQLDNRPDPRAQKHMPSSSMERQS